MSHGDSICWKKWWNAFAACWLLLGLAQPGRSQTDELFVIESREPINLDAYSAVEPGDRRIVSLYCRPLFVMVFGRGGSSRTCEGILATDSVRNFENRIEVTLRPDAYFRRASHDPLTGKIKIDSFRVRATDVVATYKNLLNSERQDFPGVPRLKKFVQDMRAQDSSTVVVYFKPGRRPRPPQLVLGFPIVPASAVGNVKIKVYPEAKSAQETYRQSPWGAGPYVYYGVNDDKGERIWEFGKTRPEDSLGYSLIHLKYPTNPNMYIQYLKDIIGMNFIFPEVPPGLGISPAAQLRTQELFNPRIHEIAFNLDRDFLKSLAVRAALSCYLDRRTLAKNLFGDVNLVNGPIPYGYNSYCDTCVIPFQDSVPNVRMADSLMQVAGYRKDLVSGRWLKDGKTLKIRLLGWTGEMSSNLSSLVDNIVNGWKQAGIDASFDVKSQSEYRDLIRHRKFDAAFYDLQYDVVPELDRYFGKGGDKNYMGFQDDSVSVLWAKFLSCSEAEILPTWMTLHKRIADQVPCAFLWSPRIYAAFPGWMGVGQQWYPNNFLGRVEYWKHNQ